MNKCVRILLSVLCRPEDADWLAALMMKHTTTLGIRRQELDRYVLERSVETVETVYGSVRVKKAHGLGVRKAKAEFDDLAALAEANDLSLEDIRREIR